MRDWESAEVTFLQYAFMSCVICSASITSTVESTIIRAVPFFAELRCWITSTGSILTYVQLGKITFLIMLRCVMLNWNYRFKELVKELGYGVALNI